MKLTQFLHGNDRGARRLRLLVASSVLMASTGLGLSLSVQPASAALAAGSICHANANNKDPYVVNSPDFTSQAGGHAGHPGPLWYDDIPGKWGDIIPPFSYVEGGMTKQFPGLNWSTFGQDIWANDCGAVYPDLKIVKTSTGDDVIGGTGEYYLNVSNIGNAVAIGTAAKPLVVRDTLPTGVVATSASGAGWDCAVAAGGGSLVCERDTDLLKNTSAGQITVQVTWVTAGSKTNTATVDKAIGEVALANNTSSVQDDITVPVLSGTVVKTVDADNDGTYGDPETAPVVGGTVKFRAVITNTSTVEVDLGALSDSYGSPPITINPTCAAARPTTLAAGASFTCDFSITNYAPAAGGSLTNTFTATLSKLNSLTVTPQDTAVTKGPAHVLSGTVVKTVDANNDGIFAASEQAPVAGGPVAFRAVITNTSAVQVALASLTDSYGTVVDAPVTCAPTAAPAVLAAGASFTCTFTLANYAPAAGGSVTNTVTATLTRTGSNDATPQGSATTTGPAHVLSGTVVKTSDADGNGTWTDDETTPAVGAAVTFRATVTNTSAVTVTLGALSDNYGAAPGTTITPACTVPKPPTLAAGASYTCEFTVANYTAAAGSSVANTFSAPMSASGSTSITPMGTAIVRTGPALSGTVVKTVDANNDGIFAASEQAPVAGGPVAFRAVITNTSAVQVALASLTDSYGTVVDAPVTCAPTAAPAVLAAGASFTCTFTLANYAPAAGGSVTNTVTATLTRTGSNDATPQGSATTTGPAHVLSGTVVKTSDADGNGTWTDDETTPAVGAAVTFRATVTNTSAVTVTLGALSDNYGAAPGTTITPACTVPKPPTLAAGASYTCEFTVANYTAAAGSSVANTFSAPMSASGSNPVTVTGTAVVRTGATLTGRVVKTSDADGDGTWTADETTPSTGAPATFRATITNTSGVTVTLGALSDDYGAAPGTTIVPACTTPKPATLAPGASYTCEFTVANYTAPAGSSVTNTFSAPLSAAGSGPVTPTGSALVRTARPDLALTKTSTGAGLTGGTGSYFIDVENIGGGNAAGPFTVTDTMPTGVVATAVSGGAAWTCQAVGAGGSISCTHAGSLASGASAPRITVSVTWVTAGDKDNQATVSQAPGETALANNTEGDVTRVTVAPTPDLKLTKSGPATTTTGSAGTYSLVVENVGTATATDVITVTDTLPAGVTASGTTSGGFVCTVTGNVVTCTSGDDLPVGAANAKTITLPVTFTSAGIKANTATVAVDGDGNAANNTSTATTSVTDPQGPPPPPPPPAADLAVKKTGPASVTPGGTATWVLTVTNKGPGNAAGFSVTDTLPTGVSLTSISGTAFTCTVATAVCTYNGVLLPGQTAVVDVVGAISPTVAGTSLANVVVVGPPDATPTDNTDTLVSVIERPSAPGQADLVLGKSAPAAVAPGDAITWTITVTNAGTADASGFTVSDPLALGLSLVQVAGDGFTCSGAGVACTYAGALGPDQVATLLVTAALAEDYTSSSVVNTASAVLDGDPTPANNTDTATTTVNQALGGVVEEPATGEEPTPAPGPAPAPIDGVDEEPAVAPNRPRALPFTGSSADSLLALAASMSLAGLALALVGRRRRTAE